MFPTVNAQQPSERIHRLTSAVVGTVVGIESRGRIAWLAVDRAHHVGHHAFKPIQRAPGSVGQQLDADAAADRDVTCAKSKARTDDAQERRPEWLVWREDHVHHDCWHPKPVHISCEGEVLWHRLYGHFECPLADVVAHRSTSPSASGIVCLCHELEL
jgi:hypothetical protein